MYVPEKNLEADKLMVGAVTGFFKVMAEAEKTNPAQARDMMEDLKKSILYGHKKFKNMALTPKRKCRVSLAASQTEMLNGRHRKGAEK